LALFDAMSAAVLVVGSEGIGRFGLGEILGALLAIRLSAAHFG